MIHSDGHIPVPLSVDMLREFIYKMLREEKAISCIRIDGCRLYYSQERHCLDHYLIFRHADIDI